jgi:cytoskeletal protein RodZ
VGDIGNDLKTARIASSVSLEEAASDTEIPETALEQIEEGSIGSFKDIFQLKDYLRTYAKYLGLDPDKIIDQFNEYMFEYTSKIPVKEIEKTITKMAKEDKNEEIISPYTKINKKYSNWVYIIIYAFIAILVMLAILWSVKQVTINRNNTNTISYGG